MTVREQSYGILPIRGSVGEWQVLMVCHRSGYWWSFPKGHSEPGELPQQTAARELHEETGLQVVHFLDCAPFSEIYVYRMHGEQVSKQVLYFVAKVSGELCLQETELVDALWVPFEQAEFQATYPEAKAVCRSLVQSLVSSRSVTKDF